MNGYNEFSLKWQIIFFFGSHQSTMSESQCPSKIKWNRSFIAPHNNNTKWSKIDKSQFTMANVVPNFNDFNLYSLIRIYRNDVCTKRSTTVTTLFFIYVTLFSHVTLHKSIRSLGSFLAPSAKPTDYGHIGVYMCVSATRV